METNQIDQSINRSIDRSQCFPLVCGDGASDGFRQLSPSLFAEILKDDRLDAGPEGEVTVFWAAVSWLEEEPSRQTNADEASSRWTGGRCTNI